MQHATYLPIYHGCRSLTRANSYSNHGVLLSLVSHTALFAHGDVAHARDLYLCAYWSVGSGWCFPDNMIMTLFTVCILPSLHYYLYCPTHTHSIDDTSPILSHHYHYSRHRTPWHGHKIILYSIIWQYCSHESRRHADFYVTLRTSSHNFQGTTMYAH